MQGPNPHTSALPRTCRFANNIHCPQQDALPPDFPLPAEDFFLRGCGCLALPLLRTQVRTFILRSENAFERALRLYPVIMVLTLWVNLFFMMYKGISLQCACMLGCL